MLRCLTRRHRADNFNQRFATRSHHCEALRAKIALPFHVSGTSATGVSKFDQIAIQLCREFEQPEVCF